MKYVELFEDFQNVRETQPYLIGRIVDEAQKYIEYLEDKENLLETLLEFINQISDSPLNETKVEILEGLKNILPYE